MQERLEWKESMGKVRMARGGPKGSLASVHRVSSRSDAQQPSVWAPTGNSGISIGRSAILLQDVLKWDV